MKEKWWGPLEEELSTLPKMYIVNLYLSFPPKDKWPFTRVTVLWGKENKYTFQGLPATDFELTLIPREPNITVVHQSEERLMEVRWLRSFSSSLYHSGPSEFLNPPLDTSPVPEHIIGIGILSSEHYPCFDFLTCDYHDRKSQVEATRTSSAWKTSKPKAI